MIKLPADNYTAARAMEFLILTAARYGQQGKSEVDGALWTVPKMRSKIEHTVPLSMATVAPLAALPRIKGSQAIFRGDRGLKTHMSNAVMDALLERMGYAHVTVYGSLDWPRGRKDAIPDTHFYTVAVDYRMQRARDECLFYAFAHRRRPRPAGAISHL